MINEAKFIKILERSHTILIQRHTEIYYVATECVLAKVGRFTHEKLFKWLLDNGYLTCDRDPTTRCTEYLGDMRKLLELRSVVPVSRTQYLVDAMLPKGKTVLARIFKNYEKYVPFDAKLVDTFTDVCYASDNWSQIIVRDRKTLEAEGLIFGINMRDDQGLQRFCEELSLT